eukprot:gene24373-1560_t
MAAETLFETGTLMGELTVGALCHLEGSSLPPENSFVS